MQPGDGGGNEIYWLLLMLGAGCSPIMLSMMLHCCVTMPHVPQWNRHVEEDVSSYFLLSIDIVVVQLTLLISHLVAFSAVAQTKSI